MNIQKKVSTLLKELIAIKSVSGYEKNIQEFIRSFLRNVGVETREQEVQKDRYNLFYLTDSPYVISCHVDTVPPVDMRFPYRAVERDGRIYGRGASDVKGALASLLTTVELFRKEGGNIPVSLAFVVDEETNTALGSERAVELLGEDKKCLVLEPTYGLLCTSQEGALEFSLKVECESAHGAEFEKVENPIKVIMKAVEGIEKRLGRKVNIIMIKGGSKAYLVPKRCSALLEVKVYKGETWQSIENQIREVLRKLNTGCILEYAREDAQDFIEFRRGTLIEILKRSFEEATGEVAREGTMPSWTDASNYHRAGYECVVFGYGNLKDSHTDRESIAVDELTKMVSIFISFFKKVS